jgi:hypothetical protein
MNECFVVGLGISPVPGNKIHTSVDLITVKLCTYKASLTSRRAWYYEWSACENGPSSTMHAGGKYFFWWSQTGRRSRSLKTGRPVFRYDLPATICTPGARSEYARLKYMYLGSSIGVRVTQAKHAAIPGYFPHEGILTTQEALTFHLLSMYMYVLTKGERAHFFRTYYLLSKCMMSTTTLLVKYVTPRRRTLPAR